MKVFMFDKVSQDVSSFGALPREAWMTLGILELVCTVGLIVPAAFHWRPLAQDDWQFSMSGRALIVHVAGSECMLRSLRTPLCDILSAPYCAA
jgi:hypothetical protein